ncbi:protein NO VEIN domain-containing protein [Streptomyces kurssanovii]|uniref:DUF3883 domain-containing protein n=1 Tax=Streptomyces kurssanovii TaxID=67312 RepID=A0ABV3I0M7_9ACTN
MITSEGAGRAAVRWLELLPVAEIARLRSLFTNHPDYSDLTPVQYADGLLWLQRCGLVTADGQPEVSLSMHENPPGGAAESWRWSKEAELARRRTGAAGERALYGLLWDAGAHEVRHVSTVSDTYGYDIEVEWPGGERMHIEVKTTTDPTRLVLHLTRHEYEVMCSDAEWLLAAVLLGARDQALTVATVSRQWLTASAPVDRDGGSRWESVRMRVPTHAIVPGVPNTKAMSVACRGDAFLPAWGMELDVSARPV